jgi:hypothetical protein
MAAKLREQAAQFDLSMESRRDASYWEIVTPLFEEVVSSRCLRLAIACILAQPDI